MSLPVIQAKGLFLIGDPHVADSSPGQRLPGYCEQIMGKLRACLDRAEETGMVPVILGDLFHWPRDNSNSLIVELIELFRKVRPWVLVGNHDKYQARLTTDVSMAVLVSAGVVRLMQTAGPQFELQTPEGSVLICATPDGSKLPSLFQRDDQSPEKVIWLAHHNIRFSEFLDRAQRIKELPGVDWLINGHIHRPQPTVTTGQTTWANPGNITRLTFSRRSKEREPAAAIWTWGCEDLARWVVPHLPFYDVFPNQDFPPEQEAQDRESLFMEGLERLAWRRTQEGTGLKEFLQINLNPELPESRLIWELYQEVVREQH
ncbi:MAG: metallophosphoesterase [Proteobacteria bacterium]|nr:metallophosphoesterase [Pseudomonadota bacterium]MBU1612014.1 metallophosphoesterase [Pseudomonadota bacterium]